VKCYVRGTAFSSISPVVYACDFNSALIRGVEQARRLLDYQGQVHALEAVAVDGPTIREIHDASSSLGSGNSGVDLPWAGPPAASPACAL